MNYINDIGIFALVTLLFFVVALALQVIKAVKNADDNEERGIAVVLTIIIFAFGGCVVSMLRSFLAGVL